MYINLFFNFFFLFFFLGGGASQKILFLCVQISQNIDGLIQTN